MPRSRPPGRTRLLLGTTVLAATLVVGVGAVGAAHVHREPQTPAAAAAPAGGSAPAAPRSASPQPVVSPEPVVSPDERLATALAPVELGEGRLSVAVLDLETGDQAGYGDDTYDTASIVKVNILVAVLLRAQDAARELTARESAYAEDMIRTSSNAAATQLWNAIGGAKGLDDANKRLGLTETVARDNGRWGLTRTTAEDQLILLSAVFGTDSVLSELSRDYVQDLMGGIAQGQDWGVSAAGTGAALKNGWLPRTATGLWDINSIGRVRVDGHDCLVAVLSDRHGTQAEGISRVEDAARAAAAAITPQT